MTAPSGTGTFRPKVIRRLRRFSEPLARITYQAGLLLKSGGTRPVILYSAGKTGSTSVRDAISEATARPVIHVHRTTPLGIDSARRVRVGAGANIQSIPDWRGDVVRWLIAADPRDVDIVTLTREPVSRAVSAFFQAVSAFSYLDGLGEPRDEIPEMTERFLTSHVHPASIHWFDWELRRATCIDVVRGERDTTDDGAALFLRPGVRLLLVRYEDLEMSAPRALAHFLGVDHVSVPHRNITAEKASSDAYASFLQNAVLPDWYLDAMYEAPMTRSFYTPTEIATMRTRWDDTSRLGEAGCR